MTYTVTDAGEIRLNVPEDVQAVLQNVSLLLRTRQGDVPLYRDFGLSMSFLDKPVTAAVALLTAEVKEAVERFEPRAEVLRVSATYDDSGRLHPAVEVTILEKS